MLVYGERKGFVRHCSRPFVSYLVSSSPNLSKHSLSSHSRLSALLQHTHTHTHAHSKTHIHSHSSRQTTLYSLNQSKHYRNLFITFANAASPFPPLPYMSQTHTRTHTRPAFITFPDEEPSKDGLATMGIKAQGSFTNYLLILALRCIHPE